MKASEVIGLLSKLVDEYGGSPLFDSNDDENGHFTISHINFSDEVYKLSKKTQSCEPVEGFVYYPEKVY